MKLLVKEEIDVFDENGIIVAIPENEIIIGRIDERNVWRLEYNGKKYWQYNYSIEDAIQPTNLEIIEDI